MEQEIDGAPVNILVVDDRPENALAIKAVLDDPSYVVVTASSGAEALKRILKQEFAVVLLDVIMPSMDGFETARLIREREASKRLPIIFLTAAGADVAAVDRGYALGAVDFLVKPIEPEIVRTKVSVFVDLFRKTRQIQRREEELRRAERERSLATIREREAEYEATFEKAAAGIAHVGVDGKCVRVNQRFCDILGYTKAEFLNHRLEDLAHADERPEHVGAFARVLSGDLESFRGQERFVHATGRGLWLDLTVSLLRDSSLQPKSFIVVAEDATERKRTEAGQRVLALASKNLLNSLDFRATLEGLAKSIVPTLADFCVVEARPDAIAREPEMVGAHTDAGRTKLVKQLCSRWLKLLDAGLPSASQTRRPVVVANVSPRIWAGWNASAEDAKLLEALEISSMVAVPLPLRGAPSGSITLFSTDPARRFSEADFALLEDLAHRAALGIENARLYKEAQNAIGARDEFLSIASHELRTPLTPLQIQLQRLLGIRGQDPLSEMPREQLRAILKRSTIQIGRLASLIDSLLDVSRIGSGRLTLEYSDVDLAEMAREVVGRFAEASKGAGSNLTVRASSPVVCRCDPLRVEQVLTNLIANAIKYGDGKSVEVTATRSGGLGVLRVKDDGIGIPEDKLPIIFDRFERGSSARAYGGLGLGLYIARCIVEAHGGTIGVMSAPGGGSAFTVELPLHRTDALPAPQSSTVAAKRISVMPGQARRVLLVEDDSEIRESIADLLQDEGYQVAVAGNGQEALDHLSEGGSVPDVILLDLMMPILDGAGFRLEQQKRPAFAEIPVVVVSGDGTTADKAVAMRAAGCLKKPVDIDELLRLVDRVSRRPAGAAEAAVTSS